MSAGEPVAQFDPGQNRFAHTPIELGPAIDQVFLVFDGTGLRYRNSLSAVSCDSVFKLYKWNIRTFFP
jgi:hypothetical protein